MIQPQTLLTVLDNSGAKILMCIRILGNNKRYGYVGDVLVGVVKSALANCIVKRSDIVRALIVQTKCSWKRKDGSWLKFDNNAVVIINKENNPCGTRVFGPVAREIKNLGFTKIISLAPEVL